MRPLVVSAALWLASGPARAAESTAPPSAWEDSCRERYDNGSPADIRRACGECLEYVPRDALCVKALDLLGKRPKLPKGLRKADRPVTDAMRQSQQHYLSGMIYFQKGDYAKARDEWQVSLKLDRDNDDARVGLERIKKLYGVDSAPSK